jgi:uncharacterized integral membrane protein
MTGALPATVVGAAKIGAAFGTLLFVATFVFVHVVDYRHRLKPDATHREGIPAYLRYCFIQELDLPAVVMSAAIAVGGGAIAGVVAFVVFVGTVVTFAGFA